AHGGDGADCHRGVVEAHRHQHRDDPLLRASGATARSGSELGRLSAVRPRSPQAPELHPARPGPRVLHRGGPNTPSARRQAEAAVRRGSYRRGNTPEGWTSQDSGPQADGEGVEGNRGEMRRGQAVRLRGDRGALSKRRRVGLAYGVALTARPVPAWRRWSRVPKSAGFPRTTSWRPRL